MTNATTTTIEATSDFQWADWKDRRGTVGSELFAFGGKTSAWVSGEG